MAKVSLSCFFLLLALLFVNINGSEAEEKVGVYELKRGKFSVKLTNYGAVVLSVNLPDKFGLFLPQPVSLWPCRFQDLWFFFFFLDWTT